MYIIINIVWQSHIREDLSLIQSTCHIVSVGSTGIEHCVHICHLCLDHLKGKHSHVFLSIHQQYAIIPPPSPLTQCNWEQKNCSFEQRYVLINAQPGQRMLHPLMQGQTKMCWCPCVSKTDLLESISLSLSLSLSLLQSKPDPFCQWEFTEKKLLLNSWIKLVVTLSVHADLLLTICYSNLGLMWWHVNEDTSNACRRIFFQNYLS